jgi:hypothetical protein
MNSDIDSFERNLYTSLPGMAEAELDCAQDEGMSLTQEEFSKDAVQHTKISTLAPPVLLEGITHTTDASVDDVSVSTCINSGKKKLKTTKVREHSLTLSSFLR